MQPLLLLPSEYVPGVQAERWVVVDEQLSPAAQVVQVVEPAAAQDPAGQAAGCRSGVAQKKPAGHCVHAIVEGDTYCPALQATGFVVVGLLQELPAGQGRQALWPDEDV